MNQHTGRDPAICAPSVPHTRAAAADGRQVRCRPHHRSHFLIPRLPAFRSLLSDPAARPILPPRQPQEQRHCALFQPHSGDPAELLSLDDSVRHFQIHGRRHWERCRRLFAFRPAASLLEPEFRSRTTARSVAWPRRASFQSAACGCPEVAGNISIFGVSGLLRVENPRAEGDVACPLTPAFPASEFELSEMLAAGAGRGSGVLADHLSATKMV